MAYVSVVVPTYNRAGVLPNAIESVLQQTFSDLELIIVDDGSTDNTRDVVEQYDSPQINYVSHDTNQGGSAARNTGIKESTGKYIGFLDSDDEWLPKKIEKQLEELESRSDSWVATYCGVERKEKRTKVKYRNKLSKYLLGETESNYSREGGSELIPDILTMRIKLGGASTLLVRSEIVERLDGFDESFRRHQDWEFLIRLLNVGKLACTDEELVRKNEYGSPSPEKIEVGKEKFLKKFECEIIELESRGYDIYNPHMKHLTRCLCKNANFRKAHTYYMTCGNISFKFYIQLLWCSINGMLRKLNESIS